MKYILLKLAVKTFFFLALVMFSSAIGFLVAFTLPAIFVFFPIDIDMDLNELAMALFAIVTLFFIVLNLDRNQRAADNCCKFRPPVV